MRAAVARELTGPGGVSLTDWPDPGPVSPDQAVIRVYGAGIGPWDVGFVSGGFPGVAAPLIPGQEVAGVVEAAGQDSGVQPGDRVWASLFPAGGGFAELVTAAADRMAPMPGQASFTEAAGMVIGAGTACEGLLDRGRLKAGDTALITAAAGGVGSAAVQIAVASGARVIGVASSRHHGYLRGLGASETYDYHDDGWAARVRGDTGGGADLLLDCAGGQTRDQAITAVKDGGRAAFIVLRDPEPRLERGITGESFAAHVDRRRLEQLASLVDAGRLRPQVETVVPLDRAAEALTQVAGRRTRGKVVLGIGQ